MNNEMSVVLGTVAMVPKGEYNSEAYYEKLNTVLYNDSTYMAIKQSTGVLPTDTEYWQLIGGGVTKEYVASQVVDNLDSNETTKSLSAKQGNKLNKSKATIYDTVADMKEDASLKTGMTAQTLGYYSANDGGGATYEVSNTASVNEYQETLANSLYANLVAKNNEISFKQIGCVADGTTNNASLINKALTVIKAKNIGNFYINEGTFAINDSQFIIPNGLHLYGAGKNSIIQVNSLTNEIFMTNEHYLNYDYKDTFILENFRINKQAIGTGTQGKRCMRFACTDNVVIKNIIFYSDVDSQFAVLDLYSNNSNAVIENCRAYKTNSSSSVKVGGFAIREYSADNITENIVIRDCYISKDGIDESLWIDAWYGTVRNILVDNFTMYDNSEAAGQSCVWISGNRSGSNCENVIISNSYFYKKELGYKLLGIGGSEIEDSTCTVKNIKILNCTFETKEYNGTSSFISFINAQEHLIEEGCIINNCIFRNLDTTNAIPCFIYAGQIPLYSINNKYYGKVDISIFGLYLSKDDLFEKAPTTTLYKNVSNIDNAKCLESIPYLLIVQKSTDITNVNIKNCTKLVCTRVFQNNNNTNGINYLIKDCQIINNNQISNNYNQNAEHPISLSVINTDVHTPTLTSSSDVTLKSTGLSVDVEVYKGIPSTQHDRNNYPIGTVFFSNTATKSIVRKISAGNETTNWEEV